MVSGPESELGRVPESEPGLVRKIAGVVLLREDNSALMQLRDNKPGLNAAGLWVFPGGHCETGESSEAGARREFLEETGYACSELSLISSFSYSSDDGAITYQLEIFAARYDGIQTVQCFEGQKVEFVPREHASHCQMPPYVPLVWDSAIEALGRTFATGE